MLDIKLFRENLEFVQNGLKKRGAERTVHNTFRFIFHPEIN